MHCTNLPKIAQVSPIPECTVAEKVNRAKYVATLNMAIAS